MRSYFKLVDLYPAVCSGFLLSAHTLSLSPPFLATLLTPGNLATLHRSNLKVVCGCGCGCECLIILDFEFYKFRLDLLLFLRESLCYYLSVYINLLFPFSYLPQEIMNFFQTFLYFFKIDLFLDSFVNLGCEQMCRHLDSVACFFPEPRRSYV
jgi:hypothetical protein